LDFFNPYWFISICIPKLIEDEQPLESPHNVYGIFNNSNAFIEALANFNELNPQFFDEKESLCTSLLIYQGL